MGGRCFLGVRGLFLDNALLDLAAGLVLQDQLLAAIGGSFFLDQPVVGAVVCQGALFVAVCGTPPVFQFNWLPFFGLNGFVGGVHDHIDNITIVERFAGVVICVQ